MKILYIGPISGGSTCFQRMRALIKLGHDLIALDTEPQDVDAEKNKLGYKLRRRIFGPPDLAGINDRIADLTMKNFFEIAWIDKGLTVKADTLKDIKKRSPCTIIIGYSPDDMLNPDNNSREFIKGLQFYDVYFTTKSYNARELRDLGCNDARFIGNSYDPGTHRPLFVTEAERLKFGGPVGFIGGYERERERSIAYIAAKGIPVRIWGEGWREKSRLSNVNIKVEGRPLSGDDYAKAISSFKINLSFLRKANRDLQTTRSIEIPACGGFMLSERTDEHLALFKEGIEAEYFNGNEELLNKILYYLKNEDKRKSISYAGYKRCVNSGYSNEERFVEAFSYIQAKYRGKKGNLKAVDAGYLR